jgi:carbon-monoxide dehydrogenase small subunit
VAEISLKINGREVAVDVDSRTLVIELVRDVVGLTGTHAGCMEARCGCCTVLMNGRAIKSCNVLAVQAAGSEITTLEGLCEPKLDNSSNGDGLIGRMTLDENDLHPVQAAFRDNGAVQCGFCTPGMVLTLVDYLSRNHDPSEDDLRGALRGDLCRCTGYQKIIDAGMDAAARLRTVAE